MKNGFAHFDRSGMENFCAAVLLLAMDVDDSVKERIAALVRKELDIAQTCPLQAWGREARLQSKEDRGYARVDLWLLFGPIADASYAFVEVKTHDHWDEIHVARQVRDQSERRVTRSGERRVQGSILLAPERLCSRVQKVDGNVRFITWPRLLTELRALRPSSSPLTDIAICHLEEKMDRPPGLDRPISLEYFEQAATTIACLREFLVECVADVGGHVKGRRSSRVFLTPGDGKPRKDGGWAWHGLAVPFSIGRQKGRIGIYKYSAAPPDETRAVETLWLEAYLDDTSVPFAALKFAPATLSSGQLDTVRAAFKNEWDARTKARQSGTAT